MEATGMHPLATKVAALLHAGLNVALVGPPGAGKSHMAADVAKLLGREYGGSISLSAGVTESALIGRVLPVLNGTTGGMWLTTPFVEAYEKGKLYLLDEMDAADSNVLLVCNQALSNGGFYIEARLVSGLDPFVAKSPLFCGLAAMNTTGSGATSQFSGRGALDAATTDRWYLIGVDYDGSYEARLTGRAEPAGYAPWQPGPVLTNLEAASWGSWVEAVRDRLKQVKSKRFFSTRALQKALGARRVGVPAKEVVQDLFFGWKPDELASLGALATFDPQGV
jgi:MoxR-like ATPase